MAMRHAVRTIGTLPAVFIAAAMLNFIAGTTLGALMAFRPAWWHPIGDIHGEINRFGWLTMMIYGMTYAVLAVSAGLRPPRAWVGWLHWLTAEAGVAAVTAGLALPAPVLRMLGLWLQALAPTLFLANILSAVAAGRRIRHDGAPSLAVPEHLRHLARSERWAATDKVGQRGTDVALMLFVVAVWATAVTASLHPGADEPAAVTVLVNNGWITGTVLAVAMHLHPRLTGDDRIPAGAFAAVQALWIIGTAAEVLGRLQPDAAPWQLAAGVGDRLLGAALLIMAGIVVSTPVRSARRLTDHSDNRPKKRPAGSFGWYAGWACAAVLGAWLLAGADPLALAPQHLLFLGWVTSLVYGVGHSLFPDLFECEAPCSACAVTQVGCGLAGALLMVAAFEALSTGVRASGLFAAGGLLAWLGFLLFAAMWLPRLLMRRTGGKNAAL